MPFDWRFGRALCASWSEWTSFPRCGNGLTDDLVGVDQRPAPGPVKPLKRLEKVSLPPIEQQQVPVQGDPLTVLSAQCRAHPLQRTGLPPIRLFDANTCSALLEAEAEH